MIAEKELVSYWLHTHGFFTIESIKVGKNKEIDILAIRQRGSNVQEIRQVEIFSSISASANLTLDAATIPESVEKFVEKRFNDGLILAEMERRLQDLGKRPYERVIVLGAMAAANRKQAVALLEQRHITVIRMESILFDIMNTIDRQDYHPTMRALQLIKFMLLGKPGKLAALIGNETGILNQAAKERFLQQLLSQHAVKRIIGKEENQEIIRGLLQESRIRPEGLAALVAGLLTARTKPRFLQAFLEAKGQQERAERKDKELTSFLERAM
ncbi:MAG TPA: hypothetical protein VJC16_06520 [Candidatus Nanoarchaeia archaeon]|nr:hypothetical protein [Candidatus Nanoarchaeia archaeon]